MHPSHKFIIRERALKFIYPHEDYIKNHLFEYNEIRQYLTNLLNLCIDFPQMYAVLPPNLHQVLPKLNRRIDPENSIKFLQDYNEFKLKSVEVNKKLNKLLAIKLIST